MKKIICILVALTLMLSFTSFAEEENINDGMEVLIQNNNAIQTMRSSDNVVYSVEITDKNQLAKYEDKSKGELVSRTITYVLPKNENNTNYDLLSYKQPLDYQINLFTKWTIGSWTYKGNQWYTPSEGTPYKIEGAAKFTKQVTSEAYYTLSGEASGKVKGLVEVKVGGEIGEKSTDTWGIAVDIPENYYRLIEVWEYKSKYVFNVKRNGDVYSTGCYAYKPNGGQKVVNDLYKK